MTTTRQHLLGPGRANCLLLLGLCLFDSYPLAAQAPGRPLREIDGRLEPDKLPEALVWDNLFSVVYDLTGGKTDPKDPDVQGFIKGNLHMSVDDAAILLEGVAANRRTLPKLEDALRKAFEAERDASEIAKRKAAIEQATVTSRDQILRALSPHGAKALRRYEAVVRQGMKVQVEQ